MRELNESDFVPLDGYSQRWRFADFTYGYVPRTSNSGSIHSRLPPLRKRQRKR
jgi:hypothetical protein